MFKVKGQRSRSQLKVMYQQQKCYNMVIDNYVQRLQTWHGVVIESEKDWHGSGGLKLQCIRSCQIIFLFCLVSYLQSC